MDYALLKQCFYLHCRHVGYSFEAGGVTDHLVQGADNVGEPGSYVAVLLPAVKHQLVQGTGAVHRRRQTVVLLDGIDHLGREGEACLRFKLLNTTEYILACFCLDNIPTSSPTPHHTDTQSLRSLKKTVSFQADGLFVSILANHMSLGEDRAG